MQSYSNATRFDAKFAHNFTHKFFDHGKLEENKREILKFGFF